MCHGVWVSDVEMIGKDMSRMGVEALATGGHTSCRTSRDTISTEDELLIAFPRSSIDLRNGNTKKPASASLFCAGRKRAARLLEGSFTRSRMQVTKIELSKIK